MIDPKIYTIELRNKNFDRVSILTKKVNAASWNYIRLGGCDSATLNLSLEPESMATVNFGYDVRIWVEDSSGVAKHRYSGYIETIKKITDKKSNVQLQISGYASQLKRVRVNKAYSDMEVSAILKDVLDTYILPETAISYNTSDIEATSFTVDSLEFDCLADSAIKTLVALAGSHEWGVDRNRNFFFKLRNNDIKHRLLLGKEVAKTDISDEGGDIFNRVVLKGGTVGNGKYEETFDLEESQDLYGARTKIVTNSAIITTSVGNQYATSFMAENAKPQRSVSIPIPCSEKFIEEIVPTGKVSIVGGTTVVPKKYGDPDAIYGQFFKYGGEPSFEISKIQYKIANKGIDITITAGFASVDIATEIKKLEFEIEQLQNA